MKKLPFILFAVLLLSVACSTIDCSVDNIVATVYSLKKANGTADTLKDTLYVITRTVKGKDTVLLDKEVNATQFQLQIGYSNPEDTLRFIVKDALGGVFCDMAYIKKENKPQFESVDCKMNYFHTITGVRLTSHHAIDSIVIKKTAVNYDLSSEHFHIYFRANR